MDRDLTVAFLKQLDVFREHLFCKHPLNGFIVGFLNNNYGVLA